MWAGEFHYGEAWAAYRGRAGDNSRHKHTTMQLVVSGGDPAELCDGQGNVSRGEGLLVRPGVVHQLLPLERVLIVFLEPQTPQAALVDGACNQGGVARLPAQVLDLIDPLAPIAECIEGLTRAASEPRSPDVRLARALAFLAAAQGAGAISRAAEIAGLSTPRLRALAHEQLGTPLTTWFAWRRLERAGHALAVGASLADAAFDAGFADQAHLTREMRKVFGITPSTAGQVMRQSASETSKT